MLPTNVSDQIARPLADEIVRDHLIELLDQRWQKTLTLLSGSGGYGKTRALAQAVRSNEQDPVGVEFYLRARPVHNDASRLGQAILETLGGDIERQTDEGMLIERVVDEFASFSPTNVVLIIDDVHVLGESFAAVSQITDIIRQLPVNAHLVLVGRTIPELPLARLQADDAVVEFCEADLRFDAAELERLASRHNVGIDTLQPLAGWPALVRLAVVSGKTGPQQFLMQEIVDELAPEVVQALLVAVVAGQGDAELFTRCDVDISPDQLSDLVPMVDLSSDGVVRPHDLWNEVRDALQDGSSLGTLVATVSQWHAENERYDDAIMIAAEHGETIAARAAVMQALDGADTLLRPASTGRWLELLGGADVVDESDAELLLLRGWHDRLADGPGHGDQDVAEALRIFHDRGDAAGEASASVELAFRGFLAGDVEPVLDAVARSPRLVESGATYLKPLGEMTNAAIAELGGDFRRALDHSLRATGPEVRAGFAEMALAHRVSLAFLAGDSTTAVDAAVELVGRAPTQTNRALLLVSRFGAGDIADTVEAWADTRYVASGNLREDFSYGVAWVFIDACLGLEPDLTLVRAVAWDRPRELVQLALCEWCAVLLAGDEAVANEKLRTDMQALGVTDPLVDGEIRRFLVSGYVAVPEVREHLDRPKIEPPLGEYHLKLLGVARILVALREGTTPNWAGYLGPEHVISSMSLPWSVEMACGLVLHDEDRGVELADALFTYTGAQPQRWLRAIAESSGPVSAGARRLLAVLPAPPAQVLGVQTQGGVSLSRGDEQLGVARVRVRQLLQMLVLRGAVSRDAAMTMLWPDKDIDKARNNLRITLSHLRDDLEPDRLSGEPSYHLRQRGDEILLRNSEYLDVDLWGLRDALATADAAAATGDRSARLVALSRVAHGWQPPLLPDLEDVPEVSAEIAELGARFRDAAVEVAEAWLSEGHYDDAERLSQKLLTHDPFDERSYAIAISAALDGGREAQAHQAIDRCLAMLSDLGVQPAAATRMLLRRARYPEDESRRSA